MGGLLVCLLRGNLYLPTHPPIQRCHPLRRVKSLWKLHLRQFRTNNRMTEGLNRPGFPGE